MVGKVDGCTLGGKEGSKLVVGKKDGIKLGSTLGLLLRISECFMVGKANGWIESDGCRLGKVDGRSLGLVVGNVDEEEGSELLVGKKDGVKLGSALRLLLGVA